MEKTSVARPPREETQCNHRRQGDAERAVRLSRAVRHGDPGRCRVGPPGERAAALREIGRDAPTDCARQTSHAQGRADGSANTCPREPSPLEQLLVDVEDRSGRAIRVLSETQRQIIWWDQAEKGQYELDLVMAALEMIAQDLDGLATRARASCAKAVA